MEQTADKAGLSSTSIDAKSVLRPGAVYKNGADYKEDPRWLLVERILATPTFKRSPRLSVFLRHISQLTLEGHEEVISEQYLGEVLFGRLPEYDSSADTIVRSHALRLRLRLEQYFQRTGKLEPLRLVIPRGGYVPQFVMAAELEGAEREELRSKPELEPIPETVSESSRLLVQSVPLMVAKSHSIASDTDQVRDLSGRYRTLLIVSLSLWLILALAMIPLGLSMRSKLATEHKGDRNHLLWSRLFSAEEPTHVVLGDSGLVLFHATARRYVSLHDYVNNDLTKQLPYVAHVDQDFARFLASRRYTSIVDATTAVRVLHLPEATPDRTLVGFSRDMHLDDFKNGNIIMLGAQEANPWVELFEPSMDFVFSIDTPDHHSVFSNRHPQEGEPEIYNPGPVGAHPLYAVIAFLPNLDTNGNVLLLEGISMAGTEAAVDLVMDDQRLLPILQKIRRPDGTLPYFELLITSDLVKDSPAPARVVAIHVHHS